MKGYTADEIRAMAADGRVEPGVSKWELDTPALCLDDLDKLDENIRGMQAAMTRLGIKSRPHAKAHKSSDLARLQIATGSMGICTAKLSEAEALAVPGVDDILMTTINVSPAKIRRAMALRKRWPGWTMVTINGERWNGTTVIRTRRPGRTAPRDAHGTRATPMSATSTAR
jgi:D-serine deaminase-like pyridoxal phosphate-dependent protein